MATVVNSKRANRNSSTGRLNISTRNGRYEVNVRGQWQGSFKSERLAVTRRNQVRRALGLKPASY